ncbi:hypothetical protein [Alteribacillus bidgolensis]|uniref:Uncharacterized protein n=1 Tax=Alteribacillus bidgolensis TaxID=930129 RepID=A0A1G8FRL5_9BACI|nr:hypothetical protein [Alteribacillus bidgolensis]SDH84793.1 hypothetical protein SAMN05216352_10356 [Alteribacillus bidgolensis]
MQKVTSIVNNTVKESKQRNTHHLTVGIGRLYKGMENIKKAMMKQTKHLPIYQNERKKGLFITRILG